MDTNATFCPKCGHKFNQGEYEYDYDSGRISYACPECEWDGFNAIDSNMIDNDLNDGLDDYGLQGVEITDEDIYNVMREIEDGEPYDDAVAKILSGIRDTLY